MILPQDIIPDKSLYVMGGRIIDLLNKEYHNTFDPKTIYDDYMLIYLEPKISYNYFLYALDWLYIINAIDLTENLRIRKCY